MIRTRGAKVNTAKWYNSGSAIVNRTVPTLYHDFANQRYYDTALGETAFPYTSVHRSTNAMQFDVNGNLIWGPAQMCTRGQDFSTTWSMSADGTASLSGNNGPTGAPSYNVTWTAPSPTNGCALFSQPTIVGANMTFSIYLRYVNNEWARVYMYSQTTSSNGVVVYVNLLTKTMGVNGPSGTGTSLLSASVTDVGGGWVRVSVSGNANPVNTSDIAVLFATATGDGVGTRVGNGAALEAASAILEMWSPVTPSTWRPEFNTTGSAWYGPRFDYDPFTHESLGLLVEQSRSNDIARTFLLDGSVGTYQAGTGSNGPNYLGGWPSARYTGDGTGGTSHFYFTGSVTPSASQSRSVSAIVAYVDTQYLQLATSANWALDSTNTYMNIDATTGAITAAGSAVTDTFSKKLADNVYHIGFTCVSSAAPTGGAGTIVAASSGPTAGRLPSIAHTGSFDIIYLFNGAGVGWNSITPTFSTASTRADDVVSMSTGSWLNTAAGTVYVEAKRITKNAGAQTFTNIGDSGGTTERNQFRVSGTNSGHIITVGGVVQATAAIGSAVSFDANFKAAYRYRAGEQRLVEDGTLGASLGNISALPGTQSVLHTGQLGSSSEKMNGWIKQLRYYNTASPSDAQLQTLTT